MLVPGSGRSGTSALTMALQALGAAVPPPARPATEANPRGFGETVWIVRHHDVLLRRAGVVHGDARPDAGIRAARAAVGGGHERRVARRLARIEVDSDVVVVKDPQLTWFVDHWLRSAARAGATPSFALMVRDPAPSAASMGRHFRAAEPAHLIGGWVNQMLHAERATRPGPGRPRRVLVRYPDLLADPLATLTRIDDRLGLGLLDRAGPTAGPLLRDLIDPALDRERTRLADLDLPDGLRTITEEVHAALETLARPGTPEDPQVHGALDALAVRYADLYDRAAGLTASSRLAAEQQALRLLAQRGSARLRVRAETLRPRHAGPAARRRLGELAARRRPGAR